jgi:hypothetical protein
VSQGRYGSSVTGVLDREPVFLPLEEQEYLASLRFRGLPKGSWLLAGSAGEGKLPTTLTLVSTAGLDPGIYVQAELVAKLRRHLMRRDGLVVEERSGQLPSSAAGPAFQQSLQSERALLTQPTTTRPPAISRRSPPARA